MNSNENRSSSQPFSCSSLFCNSFVYSHLTYGITVWETADQNQVHEMEEKFKLAAKLCNYIFTTIVEFIVMKLGDHADLIIFSSSF